MKSKTYYGIVISCEHATNAILNKYATYYDKNQLNSHLGFDAGAAHLAKMLGYRLNRTPVLGRVSRLLIDLNRSESNQSLFSTISKTKLSLSQRQLLIETIYRPYRNQIKTEIESELKNNQKTVHLSIHSFTPVLNLVERKVDIGFLYNPKRLEERQFVTKIITTIKNHRTYRKNRLTIARNSPYKGISDGCTTAMRKVFSDQTYIGIEIEVNQKHLQKNHFRKDIIDLITDSITSQF